MSSQAFLDGYLSKEGMPNFSHLMPIGPAGGDLMKRAPTKAELDFLRGPPKGPAGGELMSKAPDKTERLLFRAGRPEPRAAAPAQGDRKSVV